MRSITHCATSERLGRSYITSSSTSSRIARRPRAPVPRFSASSPTASSASSVKHEVDVVELEELLVLLQQRVLRLDEDADQRVLVEAVHRADDRQPADELGDQPELQQVLGQDAARGSRRGPSRRPCGCRRRSRRRGCPSRLSMILSMPANAPPQMNRMFVVSIWMNSWCGCLRPPCGGTDAVVPSRILSSACCTPSPDTSRVIDGFSALRAILSISSM